jgi:hypothetical protein
MKHPNCHGIHQKQICYQDTTVDPLHHKEVVATAYIEYSPHTLSLKETENYGNHISLVTQEQITHPRITYPPFSM